MTPLLPPAANSVKRCLLTICCFWKFRFIPHARRPSATSHLCRHDPLSFSNQVALGARALLKRAPLLVALQPGDDAVIPAPRALGTPSLGTAATVHRGRRRRNDDGGNGGSGWPRTAHLVTELYGPGRGNGRVLRHWSAAAAPSHPGPLTVRVTASSPTAGPTGDRGLPLPPLPTICTCADHFGHDTCATR